MPAAMQTWADFPLALLLLLGPAETVEEEADAVTDMEFLEYLGSWDESDEDWLLFEEPVDEADEREEEDTERGDEKDDES